MKKDLNYKKKKKHNIDTIERPVQSGIHDTYKSGLSRNIGTTVHVGYLHSNDDRRHKSRCIYYDKSDKLCHCVVLCGVYCMDMHKLLYDYT